MSSAVIIDRNRHSSRSSSFLASTASVIETIQEDDEGSSTSDDDHHSIHSITIDGVASQPGAPKPPKRLSFAPDPVHYRQARIEDPQRSSDNDNNSDRAQSQQRQQSEQRPSSSIFAAVKRRRTGTTIFTRGSTTLSIASSSNNNDESSSNKKGNVIQSTRQNPCIRRSQYDALKYLLETTPWNSLSYVFIFIMLFGSQIQEILLPKSWDTGCDVAFSMSIVFLGLDVVFRSIVDPLYFSWRCGKEKRQLLPGQRQRYSWFQPFNRCVGCNFAIGSFTFWCDVIGTLTFLNEIEYLNPYLRMPAEKFVTLSSMGIPISGLYREAGMTGGVGNPGVNILVAVGRAARMGRFIRTTVIVEYAAKVDFCQYLQPHHRFHEWRAMREAREDRTRKETMETANQDLGPHQRKFFHDMAAAVGISRQASEEHVRRSINNGAYHSARLKRKKSNQYSRDSSSHVGLAMRELTGQRVAVGVIIAVLLNVVFTYTEDDATPIMTMILLHGQTSNAKFANRALNIARSSVVPNLFSYQRYNESGLLLSEEYELDTGRTLDDIRIREMLNVTITSDIAETYGMFDNRIYIKGGAMTELVTTIFILLIWVISVTAFAGPVMTLVVEPIERMIMLLSMLMKDPLGYQNSPQFKSLMEEENLHYSPNWEKDVLNGMETSFLMSTILRIGSLMQVGFGSAGTEIIRSGLERGRNKDVLFLNKQGSTVSCIFLFCDIRSFTDATECLQEEVFVFTNKIAAVVHSICHSYGGSANKNIGDAFLVSWILDDGPPEGDEDEDVTSCKLYANNNQADKALLSVVKISIALYHDSYFVESMSDEKKNRLISKFSHRPGPLVQMGFGLHAGKAVQGAIGSTKKLDATYISESVERAEFLESNTKKYGTPLLMSDSFYNLLDPANQYRCRKVDQLLVYSEDDAISEIADKQDRIDSGEKMNLYTYDMDIAALWRQDAEDEASTTSSSANELFSSTSSRRLTGLASIRQHKSSIRLTGASAPGRISSSLVDSGFEEITNATGPKELDLPTGPSEYNEKCWIAPEMKKIRRSYVTNGVIFPMFESGLIAFYGSQWEHAKQCFEHVLSQMEDGPSRYFLGIIEKNNGVPPSDFIGYGLEE